MKASIFEKPGIENLQVRQNVEEPKITDHDVLVRVRMCGVNPIDHMVTSGAVPVRPLLHIPGCEISGTIEGIGKHVKDDLHEGDMVIVHSRVFDSIGYYCKIDISYKLQADYSLRHHFFDSCFYTVSDMKLFNTL